YAFISLGRTHAFISGWFLTLGYICIVALNASAFSLMFKYVFPSVIEHFHIYTIAGWEVYGMEIIIATVVLIVFGYLNVKGTGISGGTQFIFAVVMVASVVLLTIAVGGQPNTSLANMQPYFPSDKTTFAAIISIVAIAPWAYVGFDAVPQAAEEFDFPARKAFGLIIFALIAAAAIYSLMIIATSIASPWEEVVAENNLWGTGVIIENVVGVTGLGIVVIALTMLIFSHLNEFVLVGIRLVFAMARAKILSGIFGDLHPKHKTPHMAIIFTVLISAAAPWFGREALVWVVDMSSIGFSIAYFYTCYTSFFLFRWSNSGITNSSIQMVSPMKKLISLIGIVASTIFIFLLLIPVSPAFMGKESIVALIVWIVLGIAFYLFKRKEYQEIPEEELRYLILGNHAREEEKIDGFMNEF